MDLPWSSPPEGYAAVDVERWVTEPPKRAGRTPFARDRARVLHCATLRRLAAKTQVLGPNTDDFIRNRLTHTLEVAQVGRELGLAFGCDPDVVDTACLAHDLGHPPFGHNGERVLDEIASQIGGFEGNAQTLRLLTRLEAKSFDGWRTAGLNLTRASLDAATKYPWRRGESPPGSGEKFGVYEDDLDVFGWLRTPSPADGRRCLEAQVMDFADDVAYSVHDLEDGIVSGRIYLGQLDSAEQRAAVWHVVRDWYVEDADDDLLDAALGRLRGLANWPSSPYDGSRRGLGVLKNLTSDLIGIFCGSVHAATRAQYGDGPLVRYQADLVVPEATSHEIAVLKGIAAHYVMRAEERVALMDRQREMLAEVFEAILASDGTALDATFRADWAIAPDDTARRRVVVDQIASLTDASALSWHGRLVG